MMIYIRLDPNKIPPEWLEKAKKLVAELDAIDDPAERAKFIKDHDIWGEIKDRLLQLSYGKCWYSEARMSYPTCMLITSGQKHRISGSLLIGGISACVEPFPTAPSVTNSHSPKTARARPGKVVIARANAACSLILRAQPIPD
jgi:hypothetical protein